MSTLRREARARAFWEKVQKGERLAAIGAAETPPLTASAVSRALSRAGYEVRAFRRMGRPAAKERASRKARADGAERARAFFALRQRGVSCEAIGAAQTPPITGHSVWMLLVRYGLWTKRTAAEVSCAARERAARFAAKYEAGETSAAIGAAETPPIAASTVINCLRKHGYVPRVLFATLRLQGHAPPQSERSQRAAERAQEFSALRQHGMSFEALGAAQTPPLPSHAVRALLVRHALWTAQPVAEVSRAARERAARFAAKYEAGETAAAIGAAETPPIGARTVLNRMRKYGQAKERAR